MVKISIASRKGTLKEVPTLFLLSLSIVSCNMTEAPRAQAETMTETQYRFGGVTMIERPVTGFDGT